MFYAEQLSLLIIPLGIILYILINIFFFCKYNDEIIEYQIELVKNIGFKLDSASIKAYIIISQISIPSVCLLGIIYFGKEILNIIKSLKDPGTDYVLYWGGGDSTLMLIIGAVFILHALFFAIKSSKMITFLKNQIAKETNKPIENPVVKMFLTFYFYMMLLTVLMGIFIFIEFLYVNKFI